MNLHATPQPYASIQRDPRVNSAILTDPAARADHRVCADLRAGADVCIFANHGIRPDTHFRRYARERRDDRRRMNPRGNRGAPEQQLGGPRERHLGLRAAQYRFARQRYSFSRNGNDRSRSLGPLCMLRGFHIDQITLVNLCVFSKTSRSASPVRINSTGGSKRNRYFWLRSSQMAYPGTTAAPVCNATRAIPVVVPAFFPKKSTNIASSGMVF